MALNTVSLRNSLSGYLQLFANRRDVSTQNLNHHGDMVRKVDGVVEEVGTKEQNIINNRTLSDEGKATQVAALATATASKLKFLERVVFSLEDDRRQTEATLFVVKPPAHLGSDPLLQYLYGKEIRDRYQSLSPQERDVTFLKASEAELDPADAQAQVNREAVLWAFQQTPAGPMVSEDVMRRALDERAIRLNPETWLRLQQVRMLHESLNGLRETVAEWLKGLGADPKKVLEELGGAEPAVPPIDMARRMVAA
jgi:hypothetical protein